MNCYEANNTPETRPDTLLKKQQLNDKQIYKQKGIKRDK